MGGVDGRQDDVGGILSAAHHQAALRHDVGAEFVDAEVAGVDLAQQRAQDLAFGVENVALQLGKQGDCGHDGLLVETAFLPELRRKSAAARYLAGVKSLGYVVALGGVRDELRHEVAVGVDALAQDSAAGIGGIEHDHGGALEVVAVEDMVRIGAVAVGLVDDFLLEGVDVEVDFAGCQAHVAGFGEPGRALVRVLLGQGLQLSVDGAVALVYVGVGSPQTVLHLCESVQYVAADVERQHGRQNDVHQVDHLLTGRQTVVVSSHGSVCGQSWFWVTLVCAELTGMPSMSGGVMPGRYMLMVIAVSIFS